MMEAASPPRIMSYSVHCGKNRCTRVLKYNILALNYVQAHSLSIKSTKLTRTLNQGVKFKCTDCHHFLFLYKTPPPLLWSVSSTLLPFLSLSLELPALSAGPISSGFCTFQSVAFCPSEADALNKMTTVICLCHSGPSTDYIVAQKYSARGGGRMCVSAGSNSLFFYFPQSCLFH